MTSITLKRKKGKMNTNFPLKKEIEEVEIEEDYRSEETGEIVSKTITHKVICQEDAVVFLNLLSALDWNSKEFKSCRREMTKLMRQLRRVNFDNSKKVSYNIEVEMPWERIRLLKETLLEKYPEGKEISGANVLFTLGDFEDWYEVKLIEINKKKSVERLTEPKG